MRKINRIVVHCSATGPRMDVGVREIDGWHRKRGMLGIGYHYVIRRDGTRENGRPLETVGAHAQGYNADSIGVCLVGGVKSDGETPENNFTEAQFSMLRRTLDELWGHFPGAEVLGHRDLPGVKKACPSFDTREWLNGGG